MSIYTDGSKQDGKVACAVISPNFTNSIRLPDNKSIFTAYLLTNEQPPFCISCNEPFTVKHLLITCTEFNHIRNKYYTAKTVKELFSDTSSEKIINFLKETNLFNKL